MKYFVGFVVTAFVYVYGLMRLYDHSHYWPRTDAVVGPVELLLWTISSLFVVVIIHYIIWSLHSIYQLKLMSFKPSYRGLLCSVNFCFILFLWVLPVLI